MTEKETELRCRAAHAALLLLGDSRFPCAPMWVRMLERTKQCDDFRDLSRERTAAIAQLGAATYARCCAFEETNADWKRADEAHAATWPDQRDVLLKGVWWGRRALYGVGLVRARDVYD